MRQIYNDPEERDCAIWLLQHAQLLIEHHREEFICLGLRDTASRNGSSMARAVAYQIGEYITETMNAKTYEIFFDHHYGRGSNFAGFPEMTYKAGRVAWIKDMIAALEKGEVLPARPSLPTGFSYPEPKPVKFNLWEK